MTKKQKQNSNIRKLMEKHILEGGTLDSFLRSYNGPGRSCRAMADMWAYVSTYTTKIQESEDYMKETVELLDEFYYRAKFLLQFGVSLQTLEGSCNLTCEEFRSFMIMLRKINQDKYWDLWEEGIQYLGG